MGGPLTGYEAESIVEVEAVLDDSPADADEVYQRTIGHSERAIAAVAAKRAGGGGGGSLPPQWTVDAHGDVDFAPDDNTVDQLVQITAPEGYNDNSAQARFLFLVDEQGRQIASFDTFADLNIWGYDDVGTPAIVLHGESGEQNTIRAEFISLAWAGHVEFLVNNGQDGKLIFGSGGTRHFQIGANGEFGVFDKANSPAAQPSVPASSPSVQDVIDALVALGLVTQA
jgi:hypothetical protein